jgi:hypothetical protein
MLSEDMINKKYQGIQDQEEAEATVLHLMHGYNFDLAVLKASLAGMEQHSKLFEYVPQNKGED